MKLEELQINWNEFRIHLESLTNILPYKKLINNEQLVRYAFIFNEEPYVVDFDYSFAMELKIAILTFYVVNEDNSHEYGQTNKGKYAGPCFGTVLDIVKQEQSKWNAVCFTGLGESRVGIYDKIFNRKAPNTFNYQQKIPNGMIYIISKLKIPQNVLIQMTKKAEEVISSKE